ncbi:MAG: hypothetical protein R2684_10365 [Pyrinomonadaceae bacterium]
MKYKDYAEIEKLVVAFENGTIGRDEWGHAEHLIVAAEYCIKGDLQAAYKKMKNGIFNLLKAFGINLDDESPYHETLTVFWMMAVYDFVVTRTDRDPLEFHRELIASLGKDFPLEFYENETLFSENARNKFVAPDKAQTKFALHALSETP